MANRNANTQDLKIRPPVVLVDELKRVAPVTGFGTANEFAVELIRVGLRMLDAKELQIPAEILEMRARVRGETEPDGDRDIKSLVRDALLSPEVLDAFLLKAAAMTKPAKKPHK